jgi:hypothetical protein
MCAREQLSYIAVYHIPVMLSKFALQRTIQPGGGFEASMFVVGGEFG